MPGPRSICPKIWYLNESKLSNKELDFWNIKLYTLVGNLFIETSPAGSGAEKITDWIEGNIQAILPTINAIPSLQGSALALNFAGMALLTALFAWYCWMLRRRPVLLGVVIVGILFQIVFAVLVYNGMYQRRYLIYYTLIFGLWVAGCRGRQTALWLLVLMLGSLPLSMRDIPHDLSFRYANESYVSELLRNDAHPVRYIGINDWSMHQVVYCFGIPEVSGTQFREDKEFLQRIIAERPDSFLLCQMFEGMDEAHGDSCNRAMTATLATMGYKLYSIQRYRIDEGPVYLNSYKDQTLQSGCQKQE